jgi:hypothetical protein
MKQFTIVCIISLLSINLKAQTWCPPEATWYYGMTDGYTKFFYTSDTIINSIQCKKIASYYEWHYGPMHYFGNGANQYTYSQTGVTYLYNNQSGHNQFDTLFNINAQIGDKWKIPYVMDSVCADSFKQITVLNKGNKIINGIPLKWLYIKHYRFPLVNYITDTVIENMGFSSAFYFHPIMYCSGVDEATHDGLRCYSDSTFGSYIRNPLMPCDFTISTDEMYHNINFSLYPNPSNDNLTITVSDNKKLDYYEIINITGKIIDKVIINDKTFKVETKNLREGIYLVRIIGNNSVMGTKRFSVIH